jgi:hypothetical protein
MEGLNLVGFSNRIDASAIRSNLGWVPRVTYDTAMAEIALQWASRPSAQHPSNALRGEQQ